MTETGYIYGLTTDIDAAIRYIGQITSTSVEARLQRHVREALHSEHRTPVRNWIRRRVNAETRIDIMLLTEAPLDELNALEIGFIELLRGSTGPNGLLNSVKVDFNEVRVVF